MKPVVVLVGRPNVGKSTLFNRLTRSRAALVADVPGLTRDRQYGTGRVGDRPYLVVDTGGIVDGLAGSGRTTPTLADLMTVQTRQALNEADAVVFVADAREGVTALDRDIAGDLRRLSKPIVLAVNKAEGLDPEIAVSDFYGLGTGQPYALSAAHNDGVETLMEHVLAPLEKITDDAPPADVPRVAIVGRPNVGKSTLINALVGEQRVVVSDQPGTTRDSIHLPLERSGKSYLLIDTAGVRRRTRVHEAIEKFSIVKTLQAIDEANVVILVVDAKVGIGDQDAALAGHALERGRALILVVNKWDLLDSGERAWAEREVDRKLAFLEFAPAHYISALNGTGLGEIFVSMDRVFAASNCEMPTPRLTRLLQEVTAATPPPVVRGRRVRLKFAHQGGKNPPVIVVHGNQTKSLPAAYRRYLANAFRRAFGLVGTPVRIECKEGDNPYQGRPRRRTVKTARRR